MKREKLVRKQKVEIHLGVRIIEYTTKEYRDRRTGARVHTPFPAGYENEGKLWRECKGPCIPSGE